MHKEFNFEKRRKLFHVSSIIVPIIYAYCSKSAILTILLPVTILTVYFDAIRHYNHKIGALINILFINLMRTSESSGTFKLSGISYMMSGFLFSAVLFPKQLTITSWFILIFSDAIASLVGTKIGKIRIYNKTFEGSIAFFLSAAFISIIYSFYIGYVINIINIIMTCLVTTLVELYSKKINLNDNLLIPVSYCLIASILNIS
ncbi:MAG: hypothetical protein EOP33_02860 [Rickettsiaceae bacterium]|nr:MAG: hypothetical protein EOP33_02860 [Rickettsiaceae bacterium]